MFDTVIKINGIYDVVCAACLLHIIHVPVVQDLHMNMFKNLSQHSLERSLFERFLAYWVLTNGMIRLSGHSSLIAGSYYVEAWVFFMEYLHQTVHADKTLFVIASSLFLGTCSLIEGRNKHVFVPKIIFIFNG